MRGSTGLSRNRGPRHHKRAGRGHGPSTFQRPGQSKARSCGGWVDLVEGCAIGNGHDSRLTTKSERCRQKESRNGAALDAARKRKEDTYPELTGENGRTRLVVLAAEVGRRWSVETAQFLCALAKNRAQSVPLNLQGRMEATWLRRWSAILACSAARSFAVSLLDRSSTPGTGDAVPSVHEVLRDDRFA